MSSISLYNEIRTAITDFFKLPRNLDSLGSKEFVKLLSVSCLAQDYLQKKTFRNVHLLISECTEEEIVIEFNYLTSKFFKTGKFGKCVASAKENILNVEIVGDFNDKLKSEIKETFSKILILERNIKE